MFFHSPVLNFIFLTASVILGAISSKAQIPIHERFDVSKGLLDNTVYDVKLDKNGFLWIATDEGIQRFDGNRFLSFFNSDNVNKAGSCIEYDYSGRIWYQSFDGHFFYIENDTVKTLKNIKAKNYSTFLIIDSVLIFYDGMALVKVNINTLKIIDKFQCGNINVSSITLFNDAYYIAGDGLYRISENFDKIDTIDTSYGIISIFNHENELFYQFKSNSNYKIYKLKGNEKSHFYSDVVRINWIDSKDNKYYISTNLGLRVLDKDKTYYLIKDYKFSKSFFDNYGQLIASTLNAGIIIIPSENNIEYFHGLKENFTSAFFVDNLLYLSTESGTIIEFNIQNKKPEIIYRDPFKRQINHFVFNKKSKEFIILLTNEIKIIRSNGEELRSFTNIAPKSVAIIDNKYYFITATGGNGFLDYMFDASIQSEWDSVYQLSEKVSCLRMFMYYQRNRDVIYSTIFNKIFISTNTGIIIISSNGTISTPNPNLYLKKLFQIHDRIYGIDYKNQLYTYDIIMNKFSEINIPYPENNLQFILGNNSLFFTAFNRIFELRNGKVLETDLISNQNIKYIYNSNDVFLEISNSTLSYIKNIQAKRNNFPKKIIINNVNGKSPSNSDYIEIKYNKNQDIQINYTFLNLDKRSTSRLYYRINKGQWNPILSGTDFLLFPSLKPDIYNIDFATKEFGKIYPIKAFKVIVTTPIYKQTWFLILFQFIFLTIFVLYVLWQIRLLNRKNKLVTEKAQIEKNLALMTLKSIKAQMNPHFFFNALNTIQAFIYANDKLSATQYLSKFSKLTRLILENSEAEQIALANEIKTITIYLELEKMRFVNNFKFEINSSVDIDTENIFIPTMLIQPYVENAIKHGLLHKKGEKVLNINIYKVSQNQICVDIIDNGIGLTKSKEINSKKSYAHKSFSSNANDKRIDLLNKIKGGNYKISIEEIFDKDQISTGTRVRILIPYTS